ncbi:MAG: RnfABCDGE type electron transport complex subunit G [Nitrospirota bacterium]
MKDMFKITLSLVAMFVAAGIIMTTVFARTAPIIKVAKEREEKEARQKLMPDADDIVEAGTWEPFGKHAKYFTAKKGGEAIGYLISTYGKGYSSYINILIAVGKDLKIKEIKILSHGETPGLGDEIDKNYFRKQFDGKSPEQIELVKIEGTDKIQAISGVTISSRAVTNGVKEAMEFLKGKYGVSG